MLGVPLSLSPPEAGVVSGFDPEHLLGPGEGCGQILPDLLGHRLVLQLGQVIVHAAPGQE